MSKELEKARIEMKKKFRAELDLANATISELREDNAIKSSDLRVKESIIENLQNENKKLRELTKLSESEINAILASSKVSSIFNAFSSLRY